MIVYLPSLMNKDNLPNFFVVGVVKGGTTSFYHYLKQHPEVYLPPIKEVNFFSRKDINPQEFMPAYAHDVDVDLASYFANGMKETIHIAHVTKEQHYKRLFSQVDGERAIGEISNSYAICPSAAQAIRKRMPHARIFVILRNPVERAWSQYLMNLRQAKTTEMNFLKEVFSDHEAAKQGWGVNHQYLNLGLYYEQVKRYLDLFPESQFCFLLYEDFIKNPQDVMKRVFNKLGVDPDFDVESSEIYNRRSLPRFGFLNRLLVHSGVLSTVKKLLSRQTRKKLKSFWYTGKGLPQLDGASAERLWEFYREDVMKLSELLRYDLMNVWRPEMEQKRA